MPTRASATEHAERGRAARAAVPRSSHGSYAPAPGRPDPLGILEEQATTRVAELVPIRYGRMLSSPFAFYRGAAAIMASDLAVTPRSGFSVQCCGDAHLSNFGLFGSPERRLIFDVSDFDETLPGPWEWDVKRLAASMVVAGRERGLPERERRSVVLATAAAYRGLMAYFAAARNIDVWYARVDVDDVPAGLATQVAPSTRKRADKLTAKARTRDSMEALSKLTHVVDGQPRIVSRPPLIVSLDELAAGEREQTLTALRELLQEYRSSLGDDRGVLLDAYEMADFARKVVGVGSVGTQALIALLLGRDHRDPLFPQIKEAQPSAYEAALGPSAYASAGQRVVEGQRLMQASSDILLGWLASVQGPGGSPRDFYVRQLRDWKGSADIEKMTGKDLSAYGRLCGATLARAHARSGDRIAIAAYLGSGQAFDRAMAAFGEAYAEQNERDYAALAAAVESGRVVARTGV
ncbi:MAG TPA: DUF2252 domain-containing protein [Gaiellales bacterium]|nr:DUF2252 domain-containing protein [Gaiellales bacterium]